MEEKEDQPPPNALKLTVVKRPCFEVARHVMGCLQHQLDSDHKYSQAVPIVRKYMAYAFEAIDKADNPRAIDKVLKHLHAQKIDWPDGRGRVIQRSMLRSSTTLQLQHLGFLVGEKLTGRAKLYRAVSSLWHHKPQF